MTFDIGSVLTFDYAGKPRHVRVEKIKNDVVTGWDYNADHPTGGYRSFTMANAENVKVVTPQ